jgi:AraC-like DNA-binding protein
MRAPVERAVITRLPVLGGIESLRAEYRDHHFAPHTHDTFAIGVFELGAAVIRCEGQTVTADADCILTINPGAVHSARSRDEQPWHYRAFYPTCRAVEETLADADVGAEALFFVRPMRIAPALAATIRHALAALEAERESLGQEELLARVVHALWNPEHTSVAGARSAPVAVQRAREFIDANAHRPLSLGEIASAAGISRFHLVRAFTASHGVSPYAYYLLRRIAAARELLAGGWSPSAVSTMCGFADQSHLTRQFKRIVGVTPGEYAAASGLAGGGRRGGGGGAPRVGPP